jgi:acid phosphatase type 7
LQSAELGVRKYKIIILALIIVSIVNTAFAAQDQQIQQKVAGLEKLTGKFTFVVIGDNRSGDEVYRKFVSMIKDRKPDLVINVGDMITTPGDTQQWANFREMSQPITAPYFLTVGNHDVHSKAPSSEKIYKEQVDLPGNELYYSFRAGNSLFIVLDSCLNGQEKKVTGEQYRWLEGVLANSALQHKFIFIHHPLFPDKYAGTHHGNDLDRYPEARDHLQSLLVRSKVDVLFAGHEHYYSRKTMNGITHIISGGGGAPLYAIEELGGFYHFVQVTVDGGMVSGEVVDINGKVRDRF